jgi:hypothetical protein
MPRTVRIEIETVRIEIEKEKGRRRGGPGRSSSAPLRVEPHFVLKNALTFVTPSRDVMVT